MQILKHFESVIMLSTNDEIVSLTNAIANYINTYMEPGKPTYIPFNPNDRLHDWQHQVLFHINTNVQFLEQVLSFKVLNEITIGKVLYTLFIFYKRREATYRHLGYGPITDNLNIILHLSNYPEYSDPVKAVNKYYARFNEYYEGRL